MGKAYRIFERKTQTFDQYQPDYYKDAKGILQEKPTPIDCQAQIDSYRETALSSILDKFLVDDQSPIGSDPDSDAIADYVNYGSDLDALLEMDQIIDHYRQEFKTPNATRDEMLRAIRQKYNAVADKVRKGGADTNETLQAQSQGESQELHETGKQETSSQST